VALEAQSTGGEGGAAGELTPRSAACRAIYVATFRTMYSTATSAMASATFVPVGFGMNADAAPASRRMSSAKTSEVLVKEVPPLKRSAPRIPQGENPTVVRPRFSRSLVSGDTSRARARMQWLCRAARRGRSDYRAMRTIDSLLENGTLATPPELLASMLQANRRPRSAFLTV